MKFKQAGSFIAMIIICANALALEVKEQIEIQHKNFDEPLVFNVFLPSNYSQNIDKEYVLLFDFHPYSHTYLSGMHDWMSHNGEWPWLQTIIVTPEFGNRVGMLFDESGKTTPLLDFFEQQLFPTIDKKYRTNGFRIMSGFRVNGTIVLSALVNKPNLVNAHIAVSPELKDNYVDIIASAPEKLRKLDDKPRFLLFSHGINVKEEHQISSYETFLKTLQQSQNAHLDWHYKNFNDHYFMSLPLLSTILGIEKLFDDIHNGISPESDIAQRGVEAIVEHYQYLSRDKYGFEVSPKPSIRKRGEYLLQKEPSKGIEIFKALLKLYPEDPYSYHELAKAYASSAQLEQAIKYQKQAVERSSNMATWHQNKIKQTLENYLSKQEAAAD